MVRTLQRSARRRCRDPLVAERPDRWQESYCEAQLEPADGRPNRDGDVGTTSCRGHIPPGRRAPYRGRRGLAWLSASDIRTRAHGPCSHKAFPDVPCGPIRVCAECPRCHADFRCPSGTLHRWGITLPENVLHSVAQWSKDLAGVGEVLRARAAAHIRQPSAVRGVRCRTAGGCCDTSDRTYGLTTESRPALCDDACAVRLCAASRCRPSEPRALKRNSVHRHTGWAPDVGSDRDRRGSPRRIEDRRLRWRDSREKAALWLGWGPCGDC